MLLKRSSYLTINYLEPVGVVTFKRKYLARKQLPGWDYVKNNLANTRIHITSSGVIEDAHGLLQVDFANK